MSQHIFKVMCDPPLLVMSGGKKRKAPYMSLVVQFIVGEFELVEADHLPHPGVP